ncbi:Gfo/Idh/MocA family protein [Virgibacillus sp. W0181]|uniref:Gfo/Idh/MocA family protein n=1 Tax=Virgibacillus sp. W0181 TaxID=3391581 RepID=UPI003F488408
MKKVRWGILSTANIAQQQMIPAIIRATNAEVTAIATSSDVNKAKKIAEQFSIDKVYQSYEELLNDSHIDAVYIPIPNNLHKEWSIKAAIKGKHVLCEKPATMNAKEVRDIEMVFKENNVLFMEGFMYYFHPQHKRVKEIIGRGEIGEVSLIQSGHSYSMTKEDKNTNIRMRKEMGGGTIYDLGCYSIHLMRHILQTEPESVFVHAVEDPRYEVDMETVTYLSFPNGIRATFDTSFNLPVRHDYKIIGTKGSITVTRAFRPDLLGGEGHIIIEKGNKTRLETCHGDQYRSEVEHISQSIINGDNGVALDFNNTFENMRVIDACLKSLETKSVVKVN